MSLSASKRRPSGVVSKRQNSLSQELLNIVAALANELWIVLDRLRRHSG
jgi:hypothetical protein